MLDAALSLISYVINKRDEINILFLNVFFSRTKSIRVVRTTIDKSTGVSGSDPI